VQDPRVYWRGRGVGGSSAVNGQIAIRGMPDDYDGWSAGGATGWSFAEVLPYFRRLETDLRYGDEPYHGNEGPIPIYRAPLAKWGPVDQVLAEAALDAGYTWAPDHNAPSALGVSPYAINSRDERRVSVNDAYLEPARGRNQLTIIGDALVDRVLFGRGDRAVGVRYRSRGEWHDVYAGHVILSAGAVHSPSILLRSGIGPAEHLHDLDIEVRASLPVGESFQDHPMVAFVVSLEDAFVPPPGFRHTNCCIRYSSGLAGAGAGDMMIVAMNRLGDSIGRHIRGPDEQSPFGLISVWVNECLSRGRVRLVSKDPSVDPMIDENMLDAPSDLIRMRDGVRRLAALTQHPSLRRIGRILPLGPDVATSSDAEIDQWVLASCGDTQHGTSSCRMGSPNDPQSVVDPDCRVLGVDGLSVIDASIMPSVVRANTHLTAVMIGERMADRLLGP
jgi:choline dehydrogenase